MAKTQRQLESEAQAAIKHILGLMEELAAAEPIEFARNPDRFPAYRRAVVRRIWNLFKGLMNHVNSREV